MINKEELGLRIRKERENQGLSREALCGDEAELTIRQLLRIETGKSLPKLEKLEFLSRVLGIDISTFLGEERLELPADYLEKKYRLLKMGTYGDPERIAQKRDVLEKIYENYYGILPEEELFILDILERIWDIASGVNLDDSMSADVIYEDYFRQLKEKEVYSTNDLLLLSYHYFFSQNYSQDERKTIQLVDRLLRQEISGDEIYNRVLLSTLLLLISIQVALRDYGELLRVINRVEQVIEETKQHTGKPLILLTKARYSLFVEGDVEQANQFYDQAKLLGELLDDKLFLQQLQIEKENDFKQKEE